MFSHSRYRPAPQISISDRTWPNNQITEAPIWASVDLRDGNQALLEPMNVHQKQALWKLLVKLGLKQIEVGFPSASQPDFDFIRWLIEDNQIPDDVTVQVLVQARKELIDRTYESLKGIKRAIVHVYNSTSTVQRERVFRQDREGIKQIAVQGAKWVKQGAEQYPDVDWMFEYSPESFTGTEIDYAVEVCDAVMDVWQPTANKRCILNLPSTVEVATPNVFADQIEYFCRHLKNRAGAIVSVHTHNDRGCAVAAGELALLAGADRVEGTLLGNGERTGNMDLVTMAMNMYSQGVDPKLDLSNPDEIINVYTACTGLPVSPRHPWIGELVYTAFSGSHQDAIKKCLHIQTDDEPWQVAYLPIDPQDIGRDYQAVIRVNSQSGKGGMAFVLERDFGIHLPRWMQTELAPVVQKATESSGSELSSQAIFDILKQNFIVDQSPISLKSYQIERDGREQVSARLIIEGREVDIQGSGEGVVSAFLAAWAQHSGQEVNVIDYSEHAVGEGTAAEAAAYYLVNVNGSRVGGMALDNDSLGASLRALISAINRGTVESPVAA